MTEIATDEDRDWIDPTTWPNAADHPDAVAALTGALEQVLTPYVREHASARDLAVLAVESMAVGGRLLPEGGETRELWEVRWHTADDDRDWWESGLSSRKEAVECGSRKVGLLGITRFSPHRREVRQYDADSSWVGPWVEVTDAT